MKILFFCFYFFYKINKDIILSTINKDYILNTKKNIKNDGYDERYLTNNTNENEIYNIYKLIKKKRILDILECENVSNYDKLRILEDNSISPPNLHAGGLLHDFDFPIF